MQRILKPSFLDAFQRKLGRRLARRRQRQAVIRYSWAKNEATRAEVWRRDKGKCRACGQVVYLHHHNRFIQMEAAHLVYASAGGSDEAFNRWCACPKHHRKEHDGDKDGMLHVSGSCTGTLYFQETDWRGDVVDTWESPCPSS